MDNINNSNVEKFWLRNGKMILRPNGSIAKCITCACSFSGNVFILSGHFPEIEPPWFVKDAVSAYAVESGFEVQQSVEYDIEITSSIYSNVLSASLIGGSGASFSPITIVGNHLFVTATKNFENWFYLKSSGYSCTASMCVNNVVPSGWYINTYARAWNVFGERIHNGGRDTLRLRGFDVVSGYDKLFGYGVPTFSGKYPWVYRTTELWGLQENVTSGSVAISLSNPNSSSTVREPNCSGIGDTRYFRPGDVGYPMSCVLLDNRYFLVPFFSDKVKIHGTIYNVYLCVDDDRFGDIVWMNNENPSVGDTAYQFYSDSYGGYSAYAPRKYVNEIYPSDSTGWYHYGRNVTRTSLSCRGGTMTVPEEFE